MNVNRCQTHQNRMPCLACTAIRRIKRILVNMDLPESEPKHATLLREGVYMRLEFGYTYRRIEKALEAKSYAMGVFEV